MAEAPTGKAIPAIETGVDLNSPKVLNFKEASIPKIRATLQNLYTTYHRNPMAIFRVLALMLGRKIKVIQDYNAKTPFVNLADGTLSVYVVHAMSKAERDEYVAIAEAAIKPELVRLAKELDRTVQLQLLEAGRKNVQELKAARVSLTGEVFEPIDERLLAVTEEREAAVIRTEVQELLDSVFKR